jgi:hypothetical protein
MCATGGGNADKMLATLPKTDNATSPEFGAAAKVLKELVEHHAEAEESNVWADVKEYFSTEQRHQMNGRYVAAKKAARIPQ